MASPESQPRFGHSVKCLLSEKVGSCSVDTIALTRQVLKGSRSQELLSQAARNMVIQEDAILHSEDVCHRSFGLNSPLCAGGRGGLALAVTPSGAPPRSKSPPPCVSTLCEFKKDVYHHHTPAVSEAIQKNVEHSKNLQDQLFHLLK